MKRTNSISNKNNLSKGKKNELPNLIVKKEDKPNKVIKEVITNKNILVNEDHLKHFIDYEVKIESEAEKTTKKVDSSTKKTNQNKNIKEDIPTLLKKLDIIVEETYSRVDKLKSDLDSGEISLKNKKDNYDNLKLENKLLKWELINIKSKIEIHKLQSKFYEHIFYTCKNLFENYSFPIKNVDEIEAMKKDLRDKICSIFTQNNNYYYEKLNFNKQKLSLDFNIGEATNKNEKVLTMLDTEITTLMEHLNQFIKFPINYENINDNISKIVLIKETAANSLKSILSYYILQDNFSAELKHKYDFYLENSDKFLSVESKQRTQKINGEFSDVLNLNMNKVLNNKVKTEILQKVNSMCTFYENFNLVLNNENANIKINSNNYIMNCSIKIGGITKIVDNFFIFSDSSFAKIKQILELLKSRQIKNLEKVIFSFLKNEEANIADFVDKYEELFKNYHLIK